MGPWGTVAAAGPGGIVLVVAATTFVATVLVRLLLPRERRHRGRAVLFALGASGLLAVGAIAFGVMGASAGSIVQLASVVFLAAGLVGLAGLVAFDLVLARVGLAVPAILVDLLQATVAIALLLAFLRLEGLDPFSLVTTSAVLTAVVGLALQSTIANVFGGVSLQLDRTLGRGEWIEVGGRVGRIQEIGWRSTRLVTKDGDTLFVPNGELLTREVLNYSRPTGRHRTTIRVGFHYRHAPPLVRGVLLALVRETPGVLASPPPECGPSEFGDSAVVYELQYWIADYAREDAIAEEIRTRIWFAARREDLELPFPTRTLVLSDARNHPGSPGIEAVHTLNSQEET
jgi:small-conductance mechanosensitive channel